MSNMKTESLIAAKLDALRRDVTVSFGQLAAQIKTDLSELRSRIEALEERTHAHDVPPGTDNTERLNG